MENHAEFIALRNEIKTKAKQAKKKHYHFLSIKISRSVKKLGSYSLFVNLGRKSKTTPSFLKHNGALLFNPVKIAETFYFFFTNI